MVRDAWDAVQLYLPTEAETAALQKGEDVKSLERASVQPQAAGKGRRKGGPGAAPVHSRTDRGVSLAG